jgi:hypothetical protein
VLQIPAVRRFAGSERPRPAAVDVAELQKTRDLGEQRTLGCGSERIDALERVEPEQEQDLGFVLVTDAGDAGLIEERVGERLGAARAQPLARPHRRETLRQRVRTEPHDGRMAAGRVLGAELEEWTVELHGGVIRGREDQADTRVVADVGDGRSDAAVGALGGTTPPLHARRRLRSPPIERGARIDPPLPPHHHVIVEVHAAAERDHEVLSVGADGADARSFDPPAERGIQRCAAAQLDVLDAFAEQHLGEPIGGAADLGTLGHVPPRCKERAGTSLGAAAASRQ